MSSESPSSRSRRRFGTVVALLGVVGCLLGVASGLAANGAGSVQRSAPAQLPSDSELKEMQGHAIQRTLQLRSPEARAVRTRSRGLFGDLSPSEALALGGQTFKGALAGELLDGLDDLPNGQRVDRYLGDFAARIARPGEPEAIVESNVPLRARDENGHKAPVDLALEDRGGFLESANPIEPVRFDKDPEDGVTLLNSGVGVALSGVSPEAQGVERFDRLAVPDALVDTDYWVSPAPGGFQTFAVLRSPQSPEEIVLDVKLPEGAQLRRAADGGAQVVDGEGKLATISAPVASDADGQRVDVKMDLRGSSLVLAVPHRDRDVRYPLLVDPLSEGWNWGSGQDTAAGGWAGWTNHANTFDWTYADLPSRYGKALYVFTRTGSTVNQGDAAGWYLDAPGTTSYVYRAATSLSTNALNSCVQRGISDGYDSPSTTCSPLSMNVVTKCVVSSCDPAAGAPGNNAYFWLQSTNTSVRTDATKAIAGLSSTLVYYSDRDLPSLAVVNSGGTGFAWARSYSGEVVGDVGDSGLGMSGVMVDIASERPDETWLPCAGHFFNPCPASMPTNLVIDSEAEPLENVEGKFTIVVKGEDAVDNQGSKNWGNYWIDKGGPSLALSGSLWNGRVVTEPGTALSVSSSHNLHIVATDGVQGGTDAQRRSGVKSVEVRVDGETVLAPNSVSCTPLVMDSCPSTRDFTFSTGDFPQGRRTVEVVAIDQVGNKTVQAFDVIVPPGGELLSPQSDDATSRWVQFEAHADNPGLTTVKFQYRRPGQGWQDVPQGAMVNAQGQPVSTINHPLTGGNSPVIHWDVPITWALLGAQPGPLDVRARFSDGSGPGGTTKAANVRFDPRGLGTNNARTQIGAGTVDLITGNFSLQGTDATVAGSGQGISFTRSFNSRDPQANPNGPFGPGWVTSIPVGKAADFSNLQEVDDAANGNYVELVLASGGKIYFFANPEGGYKSQTGAEDLKLSKTATDTFKLEDGAANITTFVHQPSAQAGRYDVTQVSTPGSSETAVVSYDASGRVQRIAASPPPGQDCTVAPNSWNVKGCRVLTFSYASSTTATGTSEAQWGDYAGRLQKIDFRGWDASGIKGGDVALFRYDSTGKLRTSWDHRAANPSKMYYNYDAGGRLAQVDPASGPAWSLAYEQLAGDADGGRLKSVSRDTPQGTATSTVVYNVPVSGLSAPYQMGMSDVDDWSQEDYPTAATAVFPPDQVPADPPTTYSRANLHYMNRAGRSVNIVSPGGATTTSEYDRYGNVIRELSPSNRARALASGGLSVQVSESLDTQRIYQDNGQELVDELGPEHEVELENGSVVQARAHTVSVYDEGAPADKNLHLPTTVTTSAQVTGGPAVADARVKKTEYDWTLVKPTKVIQDHGGLNLTSNITYNSTGKALTSTMPKSGSGVRTNVYYTATGSGTCGGRPEWHGLLCQTSVQASGLSSDLPTPVVKTYTYDEYFQSLTEKREADGQTITTTSTYTANGKPLTQVTIGNGGTNGLVAAYGFEEPSGTAVTDSSISGSNGTVENGAVRVDYGRFGRGLKFDGTDDRVRVPDASSLDLGNLTVEAWVRPGATSGTRTIVSRGSTASGCTGPAYGLRLSGTTPQGGSCGAWASGVGIPALARKDGWSHYAVTRSGGTFKIYRDGIQVYTGSVSWQVDDAADLLIGAASNGNYFSGLIDEVRVYNRALSQAEIDSDMRRPVVPGSKHPPATPPSGLLASFGFEEKTAATQLRDSSGNGEHGTKASGSSRLVVGHHGGSLKSVGDTLAPTLDATNTFTAQAWVMFDTSLPNYLTYGADIMSSSAFSLVWTGFTLQLYAGSASVSVPFVGGGDAKHVAVTYDGSTVKVFVNGVQQGSAAAPSVPDLSGITIGDSSFAHMFDEVKIFDHARTAAQIQADLNVPVTDTQELPSDGEAVAQSTIVYDSATGQPVEQRATENGVTRSVVTGYDTLGRVTSYTDADGNTATTNYDLLGRPTSVNDGKGTKTLTYDPTTGDLEQLVDSHAGTFTADYDVEGKITSQAYPNGMRSDTAYDETGSPTALTYTKTTNCSSNCVWYDEEVTESIYGQWAERDSSLSDQDYTYDHAGRLTLVKDTPAGQGCTTRAYAYDANANRTGRTTRAPGGGGACDTTSAGTVQSSTYDAVDRLTNTGIVYDTWGRMTSVPTSHAGSAGELKTTYYVNGMVRSQSQGTTSKGWLLDPMGMRYRASIPSGATQEIMHYASDSDSPAWTEVKQNGVTQSWERPVGGIDGALAAVVSNNGSTTTTKLQITSLHGSIVGTASTDSAATALQSTFESDEFGMPKQTGSRTYGYKGAKHRRTVFDSGVIQMGVRSYVPAMGRFTSVDPVLGGSANDYDYANQDPVNQEDLDGRCSHYLMCMKNWLDAWDTYITGGIEGSAKICVHDYITQWFTNKIVPDTPWKFANSIIKGHPISNCVQGLGVATIQQTSWYKGAVSYLKSKSPIEAHCGPHPETAGIGTCWITKKPKWQGRKPVKTNVRNYYDYDPLAVDCKICPTGKI